MASEQMRILIQKFELSNAADHNLSASISRHDIYREKNSWIFSHKSIEFPHKSLDFRFTPYDLPIYPYKFCCKSFGFPYQPDDFLIIP